MTDYEAPLSSILVDVELPDPAPLPPALVDLLASLRVVLVGWYAVPEQTTPEQARDQFEASAQVALDRVARPFEDAGAQVERRLVFTGDRLDTLSRVSAEEDCDAVLIPAAMTALRRLLVPLRGRQNARRIVPLVADLVGNGTTARDGPTEVTLLHVLEAEETETTTRQEVLEPVADLLVESGVDAGRLRLETAQADAPGAHIVERAADYDAVVLGETEPSVREILFGTVPEQIVEATNVPVIVVRHTRDAADGGEEASGTE
jgi:nucleotide-binding universal stress UspA family protein